MKLYMISDMEGLSGVCHKAQTKPGTREYASSQDYLMSDLAAAIEGAHDAGADEIVIYDLHESGKNILIERLPPYVSVIIGKPPKIRGVAGIDASFDGLILIGTHAKTDTTNAVFPHAYSFSHATMKVNGIEVGEIGLEAMIAGQYNVPLVLVTGDQAAAEEAQAISPDTRSAVVKQCTGFGTALCYPLSKTQKIIYAQAFDAVRQAKSIPCVKVTAPYTIEINYQQEVFDAIHSIPAMQKIDEKTFSLSGANLHELWEEINFTYCDWLDK